MQQDAALTHAYVIKQGIVKTYNLTSRGEEKPISYSVKNEIFPMGWVFGKLQRAQYYHQAFSDCELYCVPPKEYLRYIKDNSEVMFKALSDSVGNLLNYQMRINALGQSNARSKALHTMHYLSLCFGRDVRPYVVEIPLPLTQQDLANFMGLTRETTSAALHTLSEQKIISYKRKKYVVRTDKLNELLDDEYGHRLVR